MSGPSKTVYWTINKGAQQISLSSNTISVSNGESAIVNATWLGDGVLSATSSNPNIATVSVSGNQITISGVSIGGVGISVSVSEGTLYSAGSSSITVSVNNLVTVAIPTQSGTLTYNGNQQMPEWNNFDFSKMRQVTGSTFMAANAGTYTMMFSLLDGYKWSDGTTEIKRIPWIINKASPNLSVTPPQVLVQVGAQSTVNISRNGDGALTATTSNATAATVSVSGTTATITGVTTGEATIVVSCAATTNYNAATANISVSTTISNTFSVTIDNREPNDVIMIVSDGQYSPNYNIVTVPASSIRTFNMPKYGILMVVYRTSGYRLLDNTGKSTSLGMWVQVVYGTYMGYTVTGYLIKQGGSFYWIL